MGVCCRGEGGGIGCAHGEEMVLRSRQGREGREQGLVCTGHRKFGGCRGVGGTAPAWGRRCRLKEMGSGLVGGQEGRRCGIERSTMR